MANEWGWPVALAAAGAIAVVGAALWLKIDLDEAKAKG
jgi:hypothetical protein